MDIMETIKKRKSIRAYTPEPVSKETVQQLLEAAMMAPSGSNTQPWKFYVVGGEKKTELDEILLNCLAEGRTTTNEILAWRDDILNPKDES